MMIISTFRLRHLIPLSTIICLFQPFTTLAQTSASQARLEEVVVTAQKKEESLQDISLSVSAVREQDLEVKNVVSVIDLTSVAPGFNATRNEGFRTIVSIRGIGQEANQNGSATPGVSYHVDGVYIAAPFSMDTGFLDVERIEVLRGPQGTVYGQNSIGGSINVITKDPEFDEVKGEVGFSYGNYDTVQADAVLNVPLTDNLAWRGAFRHYAHDGFTKNVSNGQDLDDADDIMGRTKLLWEPTDNLSITIGGDYYHGRANGAAAKSIVDPTPGPRRVAQDRRSLYALDTWSVHGTIEWELPVATFKSITSYQWEDQDIERDNDRTDPAVVGPSVQDNADNAQLRKTVTQEINLISNERLFGKVDWLAGFFYLNHETEQDFIEFLDFPPNTGAFNVLSFQAASLQERRSWSVYGQGTFHFNDRLRLIGGIRYTDDTLERIRGVVFFNPASLFKTEDTAVTGRAGLEWDLSRDIMTYFTWSRGFRPGGINLTFGDDTDGIPAIVQPTFESETVNAYEIGMKGDFLDGRLRANVAAFFYQFDNAQLMGTDPDPFSGGVTNLPESESIGLEGEFTAFLTDNLRLEILASYLDTEITADAFQLDNVAAQSAGTFNEPGRAAQIQNLKGNELAKSPDVTLDITLRHALALGKYGTLNSAFQFKHRGEFFHRYFNDPVIDKVPSYSIFNLYLQYEPANQPWEASLSVYNLTDNDDAIQGQFTDAFGIGATVQSFVPPRQVIGRVKYRF
ncbi:MAG: TonB-dependent receptor [Gammaproteobacteria bacterium]